jgi:hypothetical protein
LAPPSDDHESEWWTEAASSSAEIEGEIADAFVACDIDVTSDDSDVESLTCGSVTLVELITDDDFEGMFP